MPELPDVEVFRRRVGRGALHRRIRSVRAPDARLFASVSVATLRRRLLRHALVSTRRHGKWLFAEIEGGHAWLLLHFGMTGEARVLRPEDADPPHVKLRLALDGDRRLVFTNARTFGRIGLVGDPAAFVRARGLGPDALDRRLGVPQLRERLEGRSGAIKAALMDPSVVAGIGNLYADEILFQAGLDPAARARRLRPATLRALHRAMRRVLRAAIAAHVDADRMPRDFLLPHRYPGGACPKCGRRLVRRRAGGRSTWLCPHDQRRRA